ncbi:DUF6644 family protein [Streptomyces griseomycini]|uniref:DUF6644 domain-containing protein n=1 Tax=Streptomyces griseomycini TaxID=66895 RepID=A0A7W7PX15_9ACTN|nr:DUF6644 family protein [Streptomyces griseomycini]MBB4902874.1 hypothetical protein [Streptomyces griseomycini]GGQ36772.1 hypothetical protein GCM10010266_70230 [Streptomyces griseomycini]GGR63661.1 hypothetical protein GCM10015536_78470 [Streptomyces griseomycini]
MDDFFSWLERSALGEAVRTTPLVYSSLESFHILGIALLVGPAVAFDLRLLGVGRHLLPVTAAARHLLPLARLGLALAVASGSVLFVSGAVAVGDSGAAPWKLGLLLVAAVNVAVFHGGTYRTVARWDTGAPPPVAAKAAATVSILVWTAVIAAGRLLAYT